MLKQTDFENKTEQIGIVGLGYVGLPLAVLMADRYRVLGFDVNPERIKELKQGFDRTREIGSDKLQASSLVYTDDPKGLVDCKLIIVTVPTPIDGHRIPDLTPVKGASKTIGENLGRGTVIVYESTVYPGVTEDICAPILEQNSGLRWKKDFYLGYSPERVNPGDKQHTIEKIKKVVSGDTSETTTFLADIYESIIEAGIHVSPNIKTAEAAKVIENTQRDLNIALMNELALIFKRLGIETKDVLEAAGTKWNFLKFEPGLVGGHCIGVDPYYLTFKAESLGYHPQIILAGRRINDNMGKYIADHTVKMLIGGGKTVKGSKVLVLGLTFKENIADIRNTKVIDIYNELNEFGINAFVHDPYAYPAEVKQSFNIDMINDIEDHVPYDAIVLAVKHSQYMEQLDLETIRRITSGDRPIIIDVKAAFPKKEMEQSGVSYWCL